MLRVTVHRRILRRASSLQRCFRFHWNQILACTLRKSCTYRQLPHIATMSSPSLVALERGFETADMPCGCCEHSRDSSDLTTCVGGERQEEGFEISNSGLNQMDKRLCVGGARIAYRVWEVVGDETSQNQIPSACKDSVAMLFMFDLTSRCTLNSYYLVLNDIKNQGNGIRYPCSASPPHTAIPILMAHGLIIPISCSKFDDFVQLPIDVQWTIASQFITAKLFNLPWAPERNLTIGEPIIDF
ncbi:hypothetical protein HYC85_011320 [Camellia sinensis]|uniref:Uncharacterized protein n=1 Tax=Camellia sinensis TaxID=4442 RepID=A0A7J7H9Y2_CAMSI|nr:hypothetical protein HYC85_011320 [Camellia sinensis]